MPVRAARHAQIAVYGLSRGLGEKLADPTHPVLCTIVSVLHRLPEAPFEPLPAEDGLAPPHVALVQCLLIAALLGGGVHIVRRQNLVRPLFSRLRLRSQTEDRPVLLPRQRRLRGDQQGLREGSWDGIDVPLLNVTGTRDQGAKGGDWHWKTEPYEFAPAGGKYLAVLEDTDHYLGGMGTPQYPAQFDAVAQLTLAFLDAHLAEEPAARAWLAEGKDHVGACPLLFRSK